MSGRPSTSLKTYGSDGWKSGGETDVGMNNVITVNGENSCSNGADVGGI